MGKWTIRCDGGTNAELILPGDDPDHLRIEIRGAEPKTQFDVQLNQPRLNLKKNDLYILRFRGRAAAVRALCFGAAQAHAPWQNLGLYREIELTPQWADFEEKWTPTDDEFNARIHFDAGQASVPFELAGVRLTRLKPGTTEAVLVEPGEHSGTGDQLLQSQPSAPADSPPPPAGQVQFGSLRRLTPVSSSWGLDRGQPIDRYYIGQFLQHRMQHIRGHVLEIGDGAYTREFGGKRVSVSDVMHVMEGSPGATIIGDLSHAPHIPADTFDCIILTQTLQLIYDVRGAIQTVHRILKPGGVVLATVPGISQTYDGEWGGTWYWSFTPLSASCLFREAFSPDQVEIDVLGNVLAATAFLQGMAAEELTPSELQHRDHAYAVTIAILATK